MLPLNEVRGHEKICDPTNQGQKKAEKGWCGDATKMLTLDVTSGPFLLSWSVVVAGTGFWLRTQSGGRQTTSSKPAEGSDWQRSVV